MPTQTIPQEWLDKLEGVQEPLRSIAIQIIEASNGAIGLESGFRTTEHQQELWDAALAKYGDPEIADNWVARPGHSHHERGLAIDFTGDMGLLAKLASKFGLMQPMDNEPWHWEMGDGMKAEGTPDLAFEQGGMSSGMNQNPTDALANRLNAIFSIMGGNNDGSQVSPMDQTDMWGEVDKQLADEMGIDGSSLFGNAAQGAIEGLGSMDDAFDLSTNANKQAIQKYAIKKMAEKYGWSGADVAALIELWNRESGWNPEANNPTSSAAGIAQKMTSIHGPVENSYQGQVDWGLDYIAGRYGSPSAALAWHNQHNWY